MSATAANGVRTGLSCLSDSYRYRSAGDTYGHRLTRIDVLLQNRGEKLVPLVPLGEGTSRQEEIASQATG